MKKRKIEKKYTCTGFGFHVILIDVPMCEVRGIWTPDINYNALQKVVLLSLCHIPAPLTGNQIRFIRKYFALTLEAFAHIFGVTHAAVLKWEKKGDEIAHISVTTEREIRLFVLDALLEGAKDFRNAYRKLVVQDFTQTVTQLCVDAQRELVAVNM